jgi:hypothetical protein
VIYDESEDRNWISEMEAEAEGLRFRKVPAPRENTRLPWPACAAGDLEVGPAQHEDGETWLFRPDDDLPGDSVSEVEFRTGDGKTGYAADVLELASDLKAACPPDYLRLSLWMTAAAMDPRSPGALN